MDISKLLAEQKQTILDGDKDRAAELAQAAIDAGADLPQVIDRGYVAGIHEVGRLWEEGEYFLPELVQSADAMKAAMNVLRPKLLEAGEAKAELTIVIGTVEGDIHDIGKTLVGTFLEANGARVIDLGSDVPAARFVEEAERVNADVIGLSALLTTTMPAQRRVVELLSERGLRDRVSVLVGGAPVTREHAAEIGADGFAPNAVEALTEARRLAAGPAR